MDFDEYRTTNVWRWLTIAWRPKEEKTLADMNKRDLVVTRAKEAVDSGLLKPGQVISSQEIIALVPEVYAGSVGVTVSRISQADLLKRLGKNQLEVSEDFAILTLQECIDKVRDIEYKATHGEGMSGIKRGRPRKEGAPEQVEDLAEINLLEGLSKLPDSDFPEISQYCLTRVLDHQIPGVIQFAIDRLAARAQGFAISNADVSSELQKLSADNDRLRGELRTEKERVMGLREEYNKLVGGARLDRIAERKVTVEVKPAPPGGQSGGSGGHASGGMVVHRKPLMGHTPKIIRKHSLDEK